MSIWCCIVDIDDKDGVRSIEKQDASGENQRKSKSSSTPENSTGRKRKRTEHRRHAGSPSAKNSVGTFGNMLGDVLLTSLVVMYSMWTKGGYVCWLQYNISIYWTCTVHVYFCVGIWFCVNTKENTEGCLLACHRCWKNTRRQSFQIRFTMSTIGNQHTSGSILGNVLFTLLAMMYSMWNEIQFFLNFVIWMNKYWKRVNEYFIFWTRTNMLG